MAEFWGEKRSIEELIADMAACHLRSLCGFSGSQMKKPEMGEAMEWQEKLKGDKNLIIYTGTKAQQAVALEVFGSFLSRKGNRFAGRTRAGTTAYRKPTPTEGQQREVPVKQCQRIEKSRPGTPQVRVIIRPRGRFHMQRFSIAMRPATRAQCCGGHRRDGRAEEAPRFTIAR